MKLEEKGSGEIENLSEHIPDDIVLEHAVETWKLACEISKGYNERVY